MKQCSEVDFEVRWLPFQLDPAASEKASSRMEAYAKKFGKGKEEVKQMGAWMKSKFDAAELPYNFTESALVSNTFDAHRVLTAAYKHGGAAAQDKAAEALFHSYFAKEKAPNDPEELKEAAKAAGLDATALMDKSYVASETQEEMKVGKKLGVRGVPHFVIRTEGSRSEEISGAQPSEAFLSVFQSMTR
ncbi:unnamed protein product [Durusdinium trenchii]|uniref:DSBA-like thioredoxin domain-containing protein n=1 Tax=Durusdinium trenchii TaxID=1381693 RepID=A0ABP0JK78_9DINO